MFANDGQRIFDAITFAPLVRCWDFVRCFLPLSALYHSSFSLIIFDRSLFLSIFLFSFSTFIFLSDLCPFQVIVGPLVLVGGVVYLLFVIGAWSFLGIFIFFLFDVIQYGLGKTMVRCRNAAIQKTENRVCFGAASGKVKGQRHTWYIILPFSQSPERPSCNNSPYFS